MNIDDSRHLLRRFAFAATPGAERAVRALAGDAAVASLVQAARSAPIPAAPPDLRAPWTNTALRLKDTPAAAYDAARAAQLRAHQQGTERLRQWWLGEMIGTAAPLRETMALFFHNTFGSSSAAVEIPQALHGCNALVRRRGLGTIPDLLEQLVLDPAMMIQIGMDEHFKARVSDRPAKLILDRWTVGPGAYTDTDVEELSRALTGWALAAPQGQLVIGAIDPTAPRVARRTGIVPLFDERQFDAGRKTILGTTAAFDAKSAIARLARHPATARRFGRLLIDYLGVEDLNGQLEGRLAETYLATDGSVEALLLGIVRSNQFWAAESRWSVVKSPAQLLVGACRQLGLTAPALAGCSQWMTAAGQILFDTPSAGEGSWIGDEDWITPPDRLAIRYQLPSVLAGALPRTGFAPPAAAPPAATDLAVDGALRVASTGTLAERLDPAPGIELSAIERATASAGARRPAAILGRIMSTPHYQLA